MRALRLTFGLLLWLLWSSVGEGGVATVHGLAGSEYGGQPRATAVGIRWQSNRERHSTQPRHCPAQHYVEFKHQKTAQTTSLPHFTASVRTNSKLGSQDSLQAKLSRALSVVNSAVDTVPNSCSLYTLNSHHHCIKLHYNHSVCMG